MAENGKSHKVVLIRLGIYVFVNKARGGGSIVLWVGAPNFLLILCDVTTI